jgi:hypothetical protein
MAKWQLEIEVTLVEEIQQKGTVPQTVGEVSQKVTIITLTVVGIQDSQGKTALTKEDKAALAKTFYMVEDRATLAKTVYMVEEIPTMTKHDSAMATATGCQALAK